MLRAYHERGDSQARQRLIELYLPLVDSVARRHGREPAEYDDLYQVGCVGLINAIDRFDLDHGHELAAFAAPNIEGEIRRYLRDNGSTVRLPRRVHELRTAAAQADAELGTKLGRAPSRVELARHLGVEEDDVSAALAAATLELDAEAPADDRADDAAEDRIFLSDAVRDLGDRERRILYLRYVRDLGPDEIARELGISRRQLSRNSKAALTKLRTSLEEHDEPPENGTPAMTARDAGDAPDPERYLEEPYHVEVAKAEPPGEGWVANVEELPGCSARGATREQATSGIDTAIREWVADARANGREIPKPRAPASHSGRLLVRMPTSLHADLARAAEREDVSLNQFITSTLASMVGWQRGDEPAIREAPSGDVRSVNRSNRPALMANLVVLVVLVVLAVVLLVLAVTRL